MTHARDLRCPDAETLASWVEGRLPQAESDAMIEHVSNCEECLPLVDAANETLTLEGAKRAGGSHRRWLLAAAAVLALVLPASVYVQSRRADPVRELVEVAPRSARSVEARLSGGFPWAPYRGSMRAGAANADKEQMKLIGAAAEALDRAERDSSPKAQRAAAVAMVLIDREEEGIARLAAQAKDAPGWSDLAAAQYAAALDGRTSLYPEALASADRALGIDARLPEALFNRALILERMALRDQARAAWQRYLEIDPSSPWANEAREHLARLGAASDKPAFDAERIASADEQTIRTLVSRNAERARAFAEVEFLGRWAAANDAVEAEKWLRVSRSIGNALAAGSGESLLRDAVQAIDSADAARRRRIAEAHLTYRRGRIAFSKRDAAGGERELRRAAEQFANERDPMSLAARSYAAGARLAQNDAASARRELSALVAEVPERYLSLSGQVRWELARSLMFDADFSGAARILGEAEALFRRAGESVNQATVGSMFAEALVAIGRPDEAWQAQIRAFETFAAAGRIDLLDGAIGGAALIALRAGRTETARALVGISESLERGMANDLLLADTLVRKSLLETDSTTAARVAGEAASVASRITDTALRARHLADADFAMAAALAGSDARRAHDLASRALDLYTAGNMTALVAEPYLVRARAALRLGDTDSAQRDLEAGMTAVEQHPMHVAGAVIGTGVLDAGNALFEEAIRLDLERGDLAAALAHAERQRGIATATSLDQLRARLAGSGNAVLVLIALPREVLALTITERASSASRTPIAREELAALASRDDDQRLYDLLIRPASNALQGARALIVIPDPLLERVPFAALRNANGTLVERMPVSLAPSATALRAQSTVTRPATIAAIGLPAGKDKAPLPEAEAEIAEIASLYRAATQLNAADVLHIAGHTDGDATGGEALVIGSEAVSWRTVAAMRDVPRVVVLSACNTLRRPADADRRALSLGGAFVAAGASDVIGTLAPIGDADARALFLALHEQLARGVSPPAALRRVQLGGKQRAWRHLALLTTTIHPID